MLRDNGRLKNRMDRGAVSSPLCLRKGDYVVDGMGPDGKHHQPVKANRAAGAVGQSMIECGQ
jgi:hypothetical protein